MKKEKSKRLRIFDITRDGRGISKKENLSMSGLKRFFMTFKNNFGKLISINMIMVLGNFPIFFLVVTLSGYTKLNAYLPMSDLYQNLGGIFAAEPITPFSMSLYALEGLQSQTLIDTTLTYIFYAIAALSLFTFGIVNAGTAYVLRNMAMGEPVFVWADFTYAVKRNWRQALPFGIIDGIINAILIFNIYTTMMSSAEFLGSMMFWSNVVLIIVYFFMRCYIYVQMVSFKLTVFKILKNSLIFVLVGLKRNIMALLATVACLFIEILFLFTTGGILLPFAIAAPLTILLSTMAYAKVYASYFKIKEIIIDPYMQEHPELKADEEPEDEIIMRDDVTELERLAEIKKRNGIT